MSSKELRQKFLDFFSARGHKIVLSSSLIPDDPSVLLTTAGMQQFKPYFLGKADPLKDFGTRRTASIQKSFRTSDIDEVGDESHLTFFEMLGHFSFGDYFKKETIEWTYKFLTEILKIPKEHISVTVFAGDNKIPFDKESYDAWSKFLQAEKIKKGPRADNVWGPAGPEGPCGAANEVYVDDLEVATLVFMEYYCAKNGSLTLLPQKGVDVGWGFERLAMIVQDKKNIFETDLFEPLFELLPDNVSEKHKRIIVDHIRGTAFLLADGVRPSNKEAGYILRRLLRRVFVYEYQAKLSKHVLDGILHDIIHEYGEFYSELLKNAESIHEEFKKERDEFSKTLSRGIKEVYKFDKIDAPTAFNLYQSLGVSFEIIKDVAGDKAKNLTREEFDKEFAKHQEISRAGREKKFGGHGLLLDTGELKAKDGEELKKVTRLHTATHLLQAALRKVLGESVKQAGSDITAERTRFDFAFDRKLTDEEIKKVEDSVNLAVNKKYQVDMKEMVLEDALKLGALSVFSAKGGSAFGGKEKYPEKVKVYSVGDFRADPPEIFSRELCGGPHVKNTSEIGRFKILKQEAVGSGTRRIRAVVIL
ncbi:MAG: alanine--tRNA ligase [Candidatus Giovannonibacteria bacterium]|nr:MAG: alanine--tRNA ligase [Candidatus Giovannonibacteria bacterium]